MGTWIVLSHRTGAKLYERRRRGNLMLIEEIDWPIGRLHNRDIDSDRPGRTFDRVGEGRHAKSPEESAHEHAAVALARQIAERLDRARRQNRIDAIILVAEPRFLGILRGALTPETAAKVVDSIDKDLMDLSEPDLRSRLTENR